MTDMDLCLFESTSRFQIPTSAIRDEPFVRPPPCHDPVVAPAQPPDFPRPTVRRYLPPSNPEIRSGYQIDGKLNARHPFVRLYISKLPSISPQKGREAPPEAWWRKGMKEKTVNEVLDIGTRLDEYQSECIFALAALRVHYHPQHPKHFTFWGKEPQKRTAARIQRVLDLSPCPIESPIGWVGVKENTWIVNGLQASLFPTEKEQAARKGDSDGMTLRKRKNQASAAGSAGVTGDPDERPRKRTRTSKAVEKRAGETQPPASRASQRATPSIAVTSTDEPASKATKLELINVELPPVGTIEVASLPVPQPASDTLDVPSPEPTRRSARQANKRPAATVSAVSTPMTELASLPDTLSPMSSVPAEIAQEAPRPPLTRARSSSSSSGSSTAVSDSGSGGDTAVEPDSAEADGKDKDKVTAAQGKQAEPEEKVAVRTSGRVRKPAKKIMPISEDAGSPKKAAVAAPTNEGKKTRAKRA